MECQNCFKAKSLNCNLYNYDIKNCFVFPLENIKKFRDKTINKQMTIDPNYNTNKITIYDCFDFSQKAELMRGFFCKKCRGYSDAVCVEKIFNLPNILIIILDRGWGNIYDIIVDFYAEIDLSDYVLLNNKKYIYCIYGIITYVQESNEKGHFIAICKSPVDKKWYKYDDTIVTSVDSSKVENFNPYVIFYQKINKTQIQKTYNKFTFLKTPQIGLSNIGSTCYMNATLQCFSQTIPLTKYFLNQKNIETIKGKEDSTKRLSNAYYEVIQNLWPLNNLPSVKYFSPYNFKNVLGSINELFKKMEACDAKDLIIFFLE